ncbi:MAG: hypothetical protein ACD_46C00031G0003 [uncultured bacterium]|nr:MAG: hypothetical protein ACD_46C00031G0003 [uncultured bacterium]
MKKILLASFLSTSMFSFGAFASPSDVNILITYPGTMQGMKLACRLV